MTRLLLTISLCFSLFTLIAQKDNQLRTEVYFATDKHELTKDSRTILEELNKTLKQYPSFTIFVKGNTDADGSNTYNQQLSEKRVNAVKTYLAKLGMPADAFNVVAVGEEEPIADNNSADGKQKNRRVDIIINYGSSNSTTISQTEVTPPLSIDELFKELGMKSQSFKLINGSDTAIYCEKGTMILIPAGSFDAPEGTKINFKVKEVLSKSDMLFENLTTTAQDRLLNSGGMVHFSAETEDGKLVDLKAGKKLAVKIPTTNYEPQMKYFYGSNEQNSANLDWNLMEGAAIDINNSRNSVVFSRFSTNPFDDELEKMTPVDNPRLDKFMHNKGANYGYAHYYYMRDNYYQQLYNIFTKDACQDLYDVTLIEKVDTIHRLRTAEEGGFFKRLFSGKPATTMTTEVVKRTIKKYTIKEGLSASCQSLALFGKQNNMERMGWAAIHDSKHKELYDLLEVALQTKGYDNIVKRLEVKIPHYNERLVDFHAKYRAKQDAFSKLYEGQQKIWEERRKNWFKKQEDLVAEKLAKGNVSRSDINFYFFETNRLGWLNCDYFDKSPDALIVNTGLKKAGNLDAKLVFKDRMSAMPANTEGATVGFKNVPSGKKAWIVAMQFFKDGPSLAIQEFETGKEVPNLVFQKMSFPEMKTALGRLNN
jgi:OmpA family